MNGSISKIVSVVTIAILVSIVSGCATSEPAVTQRPAATPRGVETDADYLASGTVLVAMMWEEGYWSETKYYPARIVTNASEATKGQYEAESLRGDSDVAKGERHWTADVILKSHPARKDELSVGMVVLAKFDSYPDFTDEELANSRWSRLIVLDTSDLFKDVVRLGEFVDIHDTEPHRVGDVPIRNVRVSDDPDLGAKY